MMFVRTFLYRLKSRLTSPGALALLLIGLLIAVSPFIGLILPDAPIPIGWIDEDNSEFSQQLKQNVEALDVVTVFEYDEQTLTANLQTGKIEGVFVIKEGFEDAIRSGEFEETLVLLRSPYTAAAGVISESVGAQAMRLWLTHYSAAQGETLGGPALESAVQAAVESGAETPIITMARMGDATAVSKATPIVDAANTSLYLLAAYACFFMLSGLVTSARNADFAARLVSRAFSVESYRLAVGAADAAFLLPCVVPPLIAYGVAGDGGRVLPVLIMFALYLLAYGGVASLVARARGRTLRMMAVSVITIANVLFSSMLVKLPSAGAFRIFTYIFPSRWLSSLDALGVGWCILGLAVCALVYTAPPFIFKQKK